MQNLLVVTQKVDENDQLLGFFIDWLKMLAGKFEKVTVFCLEKGSCNFPSNVEVFSLGKDQGLPKIAWLLRFYKNLFGERRNYDSVLVHMNPIWMVLGGICWKILGKKKFLWYTSGGITLKLKIAEKLTDKIFTASKESFRLKSNKVIVTGHGIDTRLFQPSEKLKMKSEKLMILSVGRIAPVKNYETLVEAAKILKDRSFNFSVTMVGEAPLERDKEYEKSLKFKVKSLKLEDNFNFVGKVNHKDLPKYYQSHDLFVHLSKTGSLDKAILEAMACGMNVLSSNDASRSFLPPQLVFDQNNNAELADKIKSAATYDPDTQLRQYVINNHGLDKLINKFYDECVHEHITIYPFPSSSKSNKYTDLLYSNVENKIYDDIRFKVMNGRSFLRLLFSNLPGRSIIHIHWTNVIYGSRFILKTLTLMVLNFLVLLLLKIKGCRIVWTMHNYYPHESRYRWLDKIGQQILFKMANAVTAHQKIKQGGKVVFIPHGNYIGAYGSLSGKRIEIRRKFDVGESDILLISLGAVKPYKKIENIVEVLNKTKASLIKLLIIGKCDKNYAGKLKTLVGNSANIKLECNFISDDEIPDYLSAADYSVFWYDGSVLTSGGLVLSLSYGVPVIARNIPAADLIKNNENGFLFDNEQELAQIIKNLPSILKFDRNKIIFSVSDLGWDRISAKFIKLYHSLWN